MRFNILGFDQIKSVELGLNLDELMILRHLHDFTSSGKMEITIHEGEMYYWVNYSKFVEDLPILGMKKARVMEIFNNNLSEKPKDWEKRLENMSESSKKRAKSFKHIGLLKSFTKKDKEGTYSYFAFTKLFYTLLPSITDNDDDIRKKDLPADTDKSNSNNDINNTCKDNIIKKPKKSTGNYKNKRKNGIDLANTTVNVGGKNKDFKDLTEEEILIKQKEKWKW